mmetsp:Transcript_29734/g.28903  ORF Transcript_29734/g.28903 Transcript_29734/m.28903 type:complete len:144 (+) Transcript_29734:790-1221(+)
MTIKYLHEEEREMVTKQEVMDTERTFLNILDFDLTTLSPLTFVERYLRLLNIEMNEKVALVAKKICIACRCKHQYTHYQPSLIAASSLILSLSIFTENSNYPIMEKWNDDLERFTLYTRKDLEPIVHAMVPIYKTMLEKKHKF